MAATKQETESAAAGSGKMFAIVRVRGTVNIRGTVQDTMKMLRVPRPNACSLVPDDPSHRGMLMKVKDYVAYGEVDAATVAELLAKRGRLEGDKPLDDAVVAQATEGKYASLQQLAEALAKGEARLKDVPGLKPFFRLHPPRGGHDGPIKKHHTVGGALGYRGAEINEMLRRMM